MPMNEDFSPSSDLSQPGSPVRNQIGTLFVPVTDLERSRSWYCRVLGQKEEDCAVYFGHLCTVPIQGTAGITLDAMPMWGGDRPGGAPPIATPAFTLLTDDLQGAFDYMKSLNAEFASEIEHDQWFVVKDPDGNKLMICRA